MKFRFLEAKKFNYIVFLSFLKGFKGNMALSIEFSLYISNYIINDAKIKLNKINIIVFHEKA